jgi:hypothetical protein
MKDEYISIIGQDGEIYEFYLTDALLNFLRRLAEEEMAEKEMNQCEHNLTAREAHWCCVLRMHYETDTRDT